MAVIIKRPPTLEQKKILADKSKTSQDDILAAQDQLFMYLLSQVEQLKSKSEDES